MKVTTYIYIFLAASSFAVTSCNNDLDVIDDYRETTIVYSLLNFRDTSQYVRIQKAFLGEGNAYLMAQVADSIYPDTADFEVRLTKTSAGATKDSVIYFTAIGGLFKEEGLFTNYPHVLFKSVDNPFTSKKEDYIDKKGTYKLTVTNKRKVEEIYASTHIVSDIILDAVSPLLYLSSNINLAGENPFKTDVTLPEFGKVVNLTVRFNYTEYTNGSTFFENKTVDYVLEDFVAPSDKGGARHTYEVSGQKFFSWLKTKIKVNPSVTRPASQATLDFIFTIGAAEFYNYYTISNSSALLNDVIPSYTNLSSGLGIVSSRVITKYPNKKLTGESIDSLANGQYTDLIFD